jgi:hypothetical protein
MQSVAAVYNRLERAAQRHDRRQLYDWLMRRTDNAVRDVIAHGLSMANDPDYRLGVEADRFAREYGEAVAESRGLGAQGNRRRALIEGALRLRAGIDTDARRESTRREVERLLSVMRAEIDAQLLFGVPATVNTGPRRRSLWQVMHARPGCMRLSPVSPRPQ